MSARVVEAEHLQKSFGQVRAVEDLSFATEPGEVFGLLGPNGAGKTTALLMLGGMLAPDSGSVRISGQADPTRPQVRKSLGIAPQALAIYDDLTAEENLRFMGRLQGLRSRELRQAVDHGLDVASLSARRNDRAGTFSGGMKRRLNLACALVHKPKILLLDEPTVGVDPQSRNHIFECIERGRRECETIIYTTHYMEEAQRLCDRVAIVDHGKTLAMNTVDSLIECYGGQAVLTGELILPPEKPETLPGVLEGLHWQFQSFSPLRDLQTVLACGVEFRDLHLARPSLETVFLNLTGRSLRE
ncbi:MAG: ABC transporter ATP-binding protein [Planctomycetota bacterium]|jgi:ABC-2 type transport system ATP-binding protein